MAADFGRVFNAWAGGVDLGRDVKKEKDALAWKIARAKKEDDATQRQLSQKDDAERLSYAKEGLDLDVARAGKYEAGAAAEADAALGDGTADILGIGSMGRRGAADAQMDDFTKRVARGKDADIRYKEESANWMKRRTSGGSNMQVAAARALLKQINDKRKAGEEVSDVDLSNEAEANEALASAGGFNYEKPPATEKLPPKPGLLEKLTGAVKGMFSGGDKPAANGLPSARIDPATDKMPEEKAVEQQEIQAAGAEARVGVPDPRKAEYIKQRNLGKSPEEARRLAYGGA